jgi:hypothetical protein
MGWCHRGKNGKEQKDCRASGTAYPRLKSNLTEQELNKAYTRTAEKLVWAKQIARELNQLELLTLLKILQIIPIMIN